MPSGPVKLESGDRIAVLMRVADRAVERIRIVSEDCPIDAGGRSVVWLDNVQPRDSLTLLESLLTPSTTDRRLLNGAMVAIAQHADPAADATLDRLARSHAESAVRGEAIFWLAQKAGAKAVPAITDRIDRDPETEVKKKAVFALSQLPKDEGVPLLINVARTNANPEVRKQAFFWLGQSRDPRALDFFAQVLKVK
jgi:HEAT repeat protein